MNSEQRSAALKTVDGFLKSRGVHFGAVSTLDLVELMGVALATQPPHDDIWQGTESIVSKTINDTEPRRVESFPVEVKFNPDANKGVIKIAEQPVALSTLTDERIYALRNIALETFDGPETAQTVRDVIEWYHGALLAASAVRLHLQADPLG